MILHSFGYTDAGYWPKSKRSAALAGLDFFASVFYQEKIEGPAGEAEDELKIYV